MTPPAIELIGISKRFGAVQANRDVSLAVAPGSIHGLIGEMKADIRRLLAEGKTRQQILDSYVAEYGDRILAEPPARGFSRVFHVAPWLFLAASVGLVFVVLKRLRPAAVATPAASQAAAPPNDDESERIDEELRNLD